ncbi:MAG: leucyl/phenylalanyl-tRNA--protein transferase [Proteobacteria bacterium]|nr:leucyl/phenylalanyl-tRNA--protein transferase [Pseudomonadota bacterium]
MLITLNPHDRNQPFPDVSLALKEPNGLLAVGGCLSPRRLANAYRQGIFPWYGEDEPILWWSPDPRLVLFPENLHVSRSLQKTLKGREFSYSFDTCFEQVIDACAEPRAYADGTWISPEIKQAYCKLHTLGLAHSFETWSEGTLVGGLYGMSLGRVFFGESMFHRSSNASKAAFAFAVRHLRLWGYRLIDCQVHTGHLTSLGAGEIPRQAFIDLLDVYCELPPSASAWRTERTNA